jgi:YD repeat-containing protein
MSLRFFTLTLLACACISLSPQAFAQAGNDNPGGVTSDYHGSITTAGYYDPYTGNAKREITDIVVPGAIGAYPLKYTRTYNTRGLAGWTNNYTWEVAMYHNYFDPGGCGPDIEYCDSLGHVTYPSGGSFELLEPDAGSPWYLDANGRNGPVDLLFDCAKAESQCTPGARFEIWRADGGKVLFQVKPNAYGQYRAYAIIDPYGQQTTLSYNDGGQLLKVTEPGGRYLLWNYEPYTYLAVDNKWYTVSVLRSVQAYAAPGNLIETVRYSVPGLTKVYYDDGAEATYTYAQYMNSAGQMYSVLDTCDDPRYAGPMKFIKYDYVQVSEGGQFFTMGQVKAERNAAGDVVSQITFPTSYDDPNLLIRTETRGDGPRRTINYGGGKLTSTDFKNQMFTNTTTPSGWTITDPRRNTTTYETQGEIGALRKITYPQTDPSATPATREYTFSNPNAPYYHSGEKDENGNWTYFDRNRDGNPNDNRIWRIRYPDTATEEFTYNGFGQVLTHKLRSGGVETFRYDARGLKTLSWPPTTEHDLDPWNHPTVYTYY